MSNLPDDVCDYVGREVSYVGPEPLGRAAIRYFTLAIGDDNPLYVDDDYARALGYPEIIAPPTLVCETNQYMNCTPDADGYVGHTWKLPLEGYQMIRGSHYYDFFRPVRPSDRISATWRIREIREATSSDGTALVIVVSDIAYRSQHGDLLASNRETLVYKGEDKI